MEEERDDQEQAPEIEDLEVSDEQADNVIGGLGIRRNPADTQGK